MLYKQERPTGALVFYGSNRKVGVCVKMRSKAHQKELNAPKMRLGEQQVTSAPEMRLGEQQVTSAP